MSDLSNDLRLVMDTGKVTLGFRSVQRAIAESKANAVVVANKGKSKVREEILHACNIAKIKAIPFEGNSVELGALCGKPYSVNVLAVLDAGNSNILSE